LKQVSTQFVPPVVAHRIHPPATSAFRRKDSPPASPAAGGRGY
jgi:hypothetical protein